MASSDDPGIADFGEVPVIRQLLALVVVYVCVVPVVSSGGWNNLVSPLARRVTRPQARVERASWLPHSFALSRAPPLFS